MPVQTWAFGRSVNGTDLIAHRLGVGPQRTLVIAGIHGSEAAGVPLSKRLLQHLSTHPDLLHGRSVVFIHEMNPDGLAKGQRHNARGVDLNRNFPSDNFSGRDKHGERPLSQPESRALHDLVLDLRPDRVLTLHQPLRCIDYDGPDAAPLAQAMARHTDLPAKRLGGRPGSLGSWAGIEGDAWVITIELPPLKPQPDDDTLWRRYADMMLAGVLYPDEP